MLKMFQGQIELGERLLQDCPQDDCIVYRNTYRIYKEIEADYSRLCGSISETTARAIEKQALKLHKELNEMYFSNYALQEYRKSYKG